MIKYLGSKRRDVRRPRGTVEVLAFDSRRYVGARIGIYNPRGERVGQVSYTRNTEYLVLSGPPARLAAMAAAVSTTQRPSVASC